MKFLTDALALTLALAITSLSMSHAQLSIPVLMHYMPWFTLEGENTHWSMELKKTDGRYMMERYQQTGKVAAHFTPLIGPYSSRDEDTIRLHLELLQQAGVKGVILNWYGISNRRDYPVLKEAADTIIRLSNAAGMLWTLCYEDRTIDKKDRSEEDQVAQLQADWEYIRDAYIEQFSGTMLRDTVTKRPVFLQFGPETFHQPSTWVNMLQTVFPDVSKRPHLLGVDKIKPQNVLPDGGFSWPGWDLFENPTTETIKTFHNSFYDRARDASWYPVVGSTFPRFKDYYVQGYLKNLDPPSWWNVTVPSFNGDTIAISIDVARESGADMIQAATWNDWQEGTSFEPSEEEGYTQLLRLQKHILGRVDEASMRNAVLAYNDVKASVWQQCDRVLPDNKADCGTIDSTQVSCEASGCCWRPSSVSGPWCFHKAPSPGVCELPVPPLRNCTRTPEDRLCHCSIPSAEPSIPPVLPSSPTSSPTRQKHFDNSCVTFSSRECKQNKNLCIYLRKKSYTCEAKKNKHVQICSGYKSSEKCKKKAYCTFDTENEICENKCSAFTKSDGKKNELCTKKFEDKKICKLSSVRNRTRCQPK